MGSPLFMIDGKAYPHPMWTYSMPTQRLVEGMRNTRGVVISTPIGVNLEKFDGIAFPILKAPIWEEILRDKIGFYCQLTYYSPQRSAVVTRWFYFGDSTHVVHKYKDNGTLMIPEIYRDCKVNLIDCGGNPNTGEPD